MEKQAPKIDKRNFDGLLEDFSELIPSDPPGSKPFEAGVGLGLKKIFCRMMETLVQRLNRVPEKHFAAFLDTIGVSLLPPQAALAPSAPRPASPRRSCGSPRPHPQRRTLAPER